MFVKIVSIDREYDIKNTEIIFEYDRKWIHKIFDRYIYISAESEDDKRFQFKDYQDTYMWIKSMQYKIDDYEVYEKEVFKDTNRSKYLIIYIAKDEDMLNFNNNDDSDDEKQETS